MLKWIVLTVLAGVAVQYARKNNIGLQELKDFVFPKVDKLIAKVKS